MRLAGKVALISGGARGMGAVEAKLFAKEGATVVIGDMLAAEGRRVEADITATGGTALFVPLDVTKEDDWQRAVATAVRQFGKLDVLVNNAGVGGGNVVEHTTVEEWDRVMDVNAKGVFLGTKVAIPAMRQAGGGSIINISSLFGLVGVDNSSPQYQASKGAVRLLTKATAIRYGGQYSRQLCPPWPHCDAHDRRAACRPGAVQCDGVAHSIGALRPTRRRRLWRPVPGLRRIGVCHR